MAEKSETIATKEERVNEAKELFGRGSRNFCMKQFTEAADDLSASCAIYSDLYGPQGEECGLPYLLYAKSLIALGKDENNLIVPGEDEEIDDDDEEGEEGEEGEEEGAEGDKKDQGEKEEAECDKEDQGEQGVKGDDDETMNTTETPKENTLNEDTPTEDAPKKEDSTGLEKESGEADKDEKEKTKKVEPAATRAVTVSSSKDAKDEPQPGPSTSNGVTTTVQEETDDAAGNLQVAWEILELAVMIFERQGDKGHENLSECYSELAGISFENSHFQEAINDYTKAIEISKKTNKSEFRMLAEVHYKVGLCYLMVNDFDKSVTSFKNAIGELEKVMGVEKAKEQTDETKETINELEETKNDILEKIADVEDAKKMSIEEVKRELSKIIVPGGGESSNGVNHGAGPSSSSSSVASGPANGSGSKPSAAAAKPANDISHLIKRKKPDSASTEVEGSPAKKTATES